MDLIPNYYEFQNSAKLLSGERALENIPYELSVRGCSRPMLMSDRVLEKFGAVATVTAALYQGGVEPAGSFSPGEGLMLMTFPAGTSSLFSKTFSTL